MPYLTQLDSDLPMKEERGSRSNRVWLARSALMLFMVIEKFRDPDGAAVYRRFREKGRMLPAGLTYVQSWLEVNGNRCFQLMECDEVQLFQQWVARWNDLVEFEIIAVRTSKEAAASHESDGNNP
jgi:hypothetical protein